MTIDRTNLDAGRVDFSDITTGERLPPVHPGEILLREFLEPLGISAYRLAKDIKVPTNRITAILNGSRSITGETALRLARYFGTSSYLWVNLQARYDLEKAKREMADTIAKQVTPRAA